MKRVRFGGYTLQVPAGWPVYRLARDPGQCVRYDQHAVYLGQPGADQQCPAHLVGRTETISVQVGEAFGGRVGAVYGGPVIGGLPRAGTARSPAILSATSCTLPWPGPGCPSPAPRRQPAGSPVDHPERPPAAAARSTHQADRHAAAGLVMAGSAEALPAMPGSARSARGPRHHQPRHRNHRHRNRRNHRNRNRNRPQPPPGPPRARARPGAEAGPGATGPVASWPRARCTGSTAARPPRWP